MEGWTFVQFKVTYPYNQRHHARRATLANVAGCEEGLIVPSLIK